ncbi:4619_t:CDS:2, partial [Acaulospora colombiana]
MTIPRAFCAPKLFRKGREGSFDAVNWLSKVKTTAIPSFSASHRRVLHSVLPDTEIRGGTLPPRDVKGQALGQRRAVMSVVPKPIPKPPFFRWENPEEALQLETRRLEVLDQIQQCKSASDYKGPSLRELQKKYNRLVDKLDKLERGDELLNRLKTIELENWQRIVQMVPLVMFDTDSMPGTRPNPIDDVLSLCL